MLTNEFTISNTDELVRRFEDIRVSPYKDYSAFRRAVGRLIENEGELFSDLEDIARLYHISARKASARRSWLRAAP